MKTKLKLKFAAAFLLFATLGLPLSTIFAQGTAFTYQGQLMNGGSPASGTYNLTFSLFNTNATGVPIASPVTNNAVTVTNGLFTVAIDFGSSVWNGETNWLQIGVETNGATPFTTLTPDQQILPVPYAIFAETASNLSGTVSAAQLNGTVGNSQLANSSVTVTAGTGLSGGGAVALGGSTTLNNAGVLSVAGNSDITASTVSGAVTLGDTATSADTASTIVKRDASENFSAGTITANLAGNAATATTATNLIGSVTLAQLPAAVVTNNEPSVTLSNLSLNGSLYLPPTSVYSNVVVFMGGSHFLSAYGDSFFVGLSAGNLTPGDVSSTAGDVGIGEGVLQKAIGGDQNTAVGTLALNNLTSGASDTAVGFNAAGNAATGVNNTVIGVEAMLDNLSGSFNTVVGSFAWGTDSPSSGSYNTAFGANALNVNANGSNNVAMGYQALYNITSGNDNIAIGFNAGTNLVTGSSNIYIGSFGGAATENNTIRIGTPGIQTTDYLAGVIVGNGAGLTNLNSSALVNGVAIGAGSGNTIAGGVSDAFIGGGVENIIQSGANEAFIGGGFQNIAGGKYSTVDGGYANIASGIGSVIGGGGYDGTLFIGNTNAGNAATIGGGLGNAIQTGANDAIIGGGDNNTIQMNDNESFIGGGTSNTIANSSPDAAIVGGLANNIQTGASYAFIGGGNNNTNSGVNATISGGQLNTASAEYATISGGQLNKATTQAATVSGGQNNQATAVGSFVGGGGYDGATYSGNTNNGNAATIGGGLGNAIQTGANYAFIGGGANNTNNAPYATVGGGDANTASGNGATVGGGVLNTANGFSATVPGGYNNTANGEYSFADGQQAQALHQGAFVWADSQKAPFASTANDQFSVRAQGGVRFETSGAGMTVDGQPVAQNFGTPVPANGINITQPGNYYLTTNVTVTSGVAVYIAANEVTLNLNGFTISSTDPSDSSDAIYLANGNTDITILNGHITGAVTNSNGPFEGPGFMDGIDYYGTPFNVRVSGVSVSGCLGNGIDLDLKNSTIVESCMVNTVGGNGIVADSVTRCTAISCGEDGIDAGTASDSYGYSHGNGTTGLSAFSANNCYGYFVHSYSSGFDVTGNGLSAETANNCYGYSEDGDGIYITGSAIGCYGDGSADESDIYAYIANSCTAANGNEFITYKYNMP